MIRFLSQMSPRIPSSGSIIMHHPECLTIVRGNFAPSVTPVRNYVEKADKQHPKTGDVKSKKEPVTIPGFVNPVPNRSQGLLTQEIKQQIEEHKKRKEKPSLHNPDSRDLY